MSLPHAVRKHQRPIPQPFTDLDAFESVDALDRPGRAAADRPSQAAEQEAEEGELQMWRSSLAEREADGDVGGMAACCLRLGDAYLVRGRGEEAAEMYRQALALSRMLQARACP